uniref:Uncharacterized protein n=1 Tax=Anguilla anguilla TaxID=7936 RepID=A0A0E9XMS4_ANGAN
MLCARYAPTSLALSVHLCDIYNSTVSERPLAPPSWHL